MKSIAAKVPTELARRVEKAAGERKQTVSGFLRSAAENEIAGRRRQAFGERFGHCAGGAKGLPSNASEIEGYAG
jgi:hypothetical protein